MHIPDGYLSPSTCVTLGSAMLPLWYRASQRIKREVSIEKIPLLAMGAVFSFLIMMFNIPIPGGTTAHATGSVLIAIVLGPWAAVITVSIALLIQALMFGDGGILAFAANAFNIAFVMSFVGYYLYRLVAAGASPTSLRGMLAAAVGGYVGLNAAALATAIELGIQPLLFKTANGVPLYSPYGLEVAIPAMMGHHLLIAGFVEAVMTAVVLKFVLQALPAKLKCVTQE